MAERDDSIPGDGRGGSTGDGVLDNMPPLQSGLSSMRKSPAEKGNFPPSTGSQTKPESSACPSTGGAGHSHVAATGGGATRTASTTCPATSGGVSSLPQLHAGQQVPAAAAQTSRSSSDRPGDDPVKKLSNCAPRWLAVHEERGPCSQCELCGKAAPFAPRMYTHPMQWTSSQLQALGAERNLSPTSCVCRQCMLNLMNLLANGPSRLAGGTAASGPVADTIEAALSRKSRSSTSDGAPGSRTSDSGADSRHPPPAGASSKRTARQASDSGSNGALSSSSGEDSDGDRTFRVGKSKKKPVPPPPSKQVMCAYPNCPEVARHHIGQRSHPAAATLLSLSWDVIKSSCDSKGRLPLCNEHHQTINQLNGPGGKSQQYKTALQEMNEQAYRLGDYGPSFSSSSKSCATGSSSRKGRRWRAIDTNTPFARALRALPKAEDRPERTYCGLVRMPVTCLLPASHDMALDRDVEHIAPQDAASPIKEETLVPRHFTRRLQGIVPIDMISGNPVPAVQLLYSEKNIQEKALAAAAASKPVPRQNAARPIAAPVKPLQAPMYNQMRKSQPMPQSRPNPNLRGPSNQPYRSVGGPPHSSAPSLVKNASSPSSLRYPLHTSSGKLVGRVPPASASTGPYSRPAENRPPYSHHQGQFQPWMASQRPVVHQPPMGARGPSPNHPRGPPHMSPPGASPPRSIAPRPIVGGARPGGPSEPPPHYFQVNGIRQHLDIPAQLTDRDIQMQEEKVRELHRKLQEAAAR